MAKYKTLNNCVAKFIIQNAVLGNPKFTFIRLYNTHCDGDFEPEVFKRLYNIVKRLLLDFHELEDIIYALNDCPLSVRAWFNKYKDELKGGVKE